MTTSGLNWSTHAFHCANKALGSPFFHGVPGGDVNHSTCTSWSIDTQQPGLPTFTATTSYCDITRPSPTPRVPAKESPTMSTFTGCAYAVVVPDAPEDSAPCSAVIDAAATAGSSTVARKVVSTARPAAAGMATGAHHCGRWPRRMGNSTRYADAVATAMITTSRTT